MVVTMAGHSSEHWTGARRWVSNFSSVNVAVLRQMP